MKIALITGITGQDGSYLAELLIEKGYVVYGLIRRVSNINTTRIEHLYGNEKLILKYGDMTDKTCFITILNTIRVENEDLERLEIYNLAAMSHVKVSYELPNYTTDVCAIGVLNLLEAIRHSPLKDKIRFYQASTSEMFGDTKVAPQNENTPFNPNSPYAIAKLYGYHITNSYKTGYGIFACNGILFNHEGPRRAHNFVTRKITMGVAKIMNGIEDYISLGNLDSKRDWGHTKDYCIDLDSKILTPSGYKSREEIKIGDSIINYNLNENKWEKDIIDEVFDIEYEGNMYTFKGNGFKFRCSENHTIYYQQKSKKSKNWGNWGIFKKITAGEMYRFFENKSLRSKYDYRFPGMIGNFESNDVNIKDDMIKLIGYLLTEGCLSKSKKIGGGMCLSVSQSKKKYFNELNLLIKNLNLNFRLRERPDEVCEFIFDSKSRDLILDYFDTNDIHIMPSNFYNLSSRQAKILFNSMMNADGCWASLIYTSKRYKLSKDFNFICNLAGFRTKIHLRKSGIYNVQIFSHAKKSVYQYVTNISKNYCQENIWCVKSRNNGTIISEKSGINGTFISGNCNGMFLMLQQDEPNNYVLATGKQYSIREFVEMAFKVVDIDIEWEGKGLDEVGVDSKSGRVYVKIDPKYFRPNEVSNLLGDPTKAQQLLGWKHKYDIHALVNEMVHHDLKLYGNN